MTELPILQDLGIIIVAATLFVLVARGLKAPTIVAYIVAGLALGPATGLLHVSHSVELIAETGIALLLFLVGLELSFDKIRDVGRVVLWTATVQVLLTAGGGFAIAYLLGFALVPALLLAVALTFSSTVVVVKLLDQKEESGALHGRIAVGVLLVQDVLVIVVLTLITGLGGQEAAGFSAILPGLLRALGGMALLLLGTVLASRYLLPRVTGWVANSMETLFIWSLAWCFLFIAAAEVLELSQEIGAFLAGISLAQLPYSHELQRRVHPLTNFFVAVFFVSLGVQMEMGAALERWPAVLLLSLFVMLGKAGMVFWAVARHGYPTETGFRAGISLAQMSEFSFILAALGMSAGFIDASVLSLISAVGLVTIAASSYLILYDRSLYGALCARGWLPAAPQNPRAAAPASTPLEDHVIVVGMNALGQRIALSLIERGEVVVAVDSDARKLQELPCVTVLGNADNPSVLTEAGLSRAKLLVSALQIEDANHLLAYRGKNAGVPTCIHAFDQAVVDELRELGADYLIFSKNSGTRRVAAELHRAGVLGA